MYTHTQSRTIGAPLRLHTIGTSLRLSTLKTLYTYTYIVRVHAHALTYNGCIVQDVCAEHCTRTRTLCTYTHTHSRTIDPLLRLHTIDASLRLSTPNTIHVHYARTRTCTHVQWVQHSGCTRQTLYTYMYMHSCTISVPLRLHTPSTVQAHAHVL